MAVTIGFGVLTLGYFLEMVGDVLALLGLKSASADQLGPADWVQGAAALLVFIAFAATVVLYCMWIHRASRNLRALGATGLRFTPGWAVGWWFVPIMNIWRPYQVVREIWRESAPTAQSLRLVGIWWALWLISNWVDNLTLRLSLKSQSTNWLDLVASAIDVAAAIVAVLVVQRITAWQVQRAATQSPAA